MISFELCDEKVRTCKNREEINDALPFSYLLIIENQEYFSHHLTPDDPEMISRSTKASWYSISIHQRSDYVKKIQV